MAHLRKQTAEYCVYNRRERVGGWLVILWDRGCCNFITVSDRTKASPTISSVLDEFVGASITGYCSIINAIIIGKFIVKDGLLGWSVLPRLHSSNVRQSKSNCIFIAIEMCMGSGPRGGEERINIWIEVMLWVLVEVKINSCSNFWFSCKDFFLSCWRASGGTHETWYQHVQRKEVKAP